MSRRFRQRSAQTQGINLRTLLYVGSFCIALLLFTSVIVVTFFKSEESTAIQNPMVITSITAMQNTTSLNKGTRNAEVLCVIVKTRGNSNKLTITSFELASRGSTKPARNIIENARLWYSGNENHFSTNQQLGSTLAEIPDGNFTITARQTLQQGDNYFWLTYDIGSPSTNNLVVDAECIEIKVGTLAYQTNVAAPSGTISINDNFPFYSMGNSDISSLKAWNNKRDGSGFNPESFSVTGATFHIQSGHIMQNALNACIPNIIIEKNGVLRSVSGINAEVLEIQAGGLYIQSTDIPVSSKLNRFVIANHGNYIHANKGLIPGINHEFSTHSTITLKSIGIKTLATYYEWGNLVIDCDNIADYNLSSGVKRVKGNLELRNNGSNKHLYFSSNDSIYIGRNLIINGGSITTSPNGNYVVLNIGNQLVVNNGTFADCLTGGNMRGGTSINLGNACAINGDGFQFSGKQSVIFINKPGTNWFQKNENITLPDVVIKENSSLTILGDYFGKISEGKSLSVESGATLKCENAIISGEGGLNLGNFATISTSHPEGFYSHENKGAIQTDKRNFSSEASYQYTGSTSPQKTGKFETSPIPHTVKNIVVSKSFFNNILILQQPFYYSGNLMLDKGNINKNNHILQPLISEASVPTRIPSGSLQ